MVGFSGGSKVTFRNSNADTGLKPFILWPADYGTAPAPSWARVDSRDSVLAAVTAQHFLDWIRPQCGFEEHCSGLEQGCHDGGISCPSADASRARSRVRRPAERRGVEVVLGWLLALTSAPASRSQAGEGVAVWWSGRCFVLRTRRGCNKKAPLAQMRRGATLARPLRPLASRVSP